jgi:N-acetylglucosamine-6-sulfatase
VSRLAAMAALILAVGIGGSAAGGSTVAAPLGQPANVVLVLTDDQSFESVTRMPFLSGRGDWFTFTHAYLNNAICCPTRASILTGQYSHHTGVESTGGAPAFDDRNTVAVWLHGAGYRTGYFGKWHLGTKGFKRPVGYVPPGWDDWYAWEPPGGDGGGDAYYGYTLNENGTLVSYGDSEQDYSTDVLAGKAIDFLRQAPEPFFLYLAPRAPHNPWTPAPRHEGLFATVPIVQSPDFNEADMSDKPAWWQTQPLRKESNENPARRSEWETSLAVDDALRELWNELEARGVLERTVVIFMTDNGYAYGEHRYNGKACAYEECSHTPLLVWYPGAPAKTVPELVSSVDVAPTLAELAGIPTGAPIDGRSFVPLLTGPSPTTWPRNLLLRGYNGGLAPGQPPTYWGLRTLRYKYIETVGTGEVELYDLPRDPYELASVAGDPHYAGDMATLAARLANIRSQPPVQR